MDSFIFEKEVAEKFKKDYSPCQAVCNKVEIYELPQDLKYIRRLKKVLTEKVENVFNKLHIMPKGKASLKGINKRSNM